MKPHPVALQDRLETIDALRGLALFGVMAINVVVLFRTSVFEQTITASEIDHIVDRFLSVFVASKAYALFCILFGLGLAIQFERLANNSRRIVLLLRRLIVLLAIGLVHLILIWNGDILTEYALAGFVALPFLYGPRWFQAVSASLCWVFYLTAPPFFSYPDSAGIQDHAAAARLAYGDGSFSDVLMFRIQELPLLLPSYAHDFPRIVALFLLGAFIWRTGVLRRASTNRSTLFSVAALGILIGLASTLTLRGPVRSLAPIVLALGYGAMAISLMTTSVGRRLLGWAAPLGRMAFTNYLAQSVIFGWVFYGYGLGLFGQVGPATALCIGTAVYASQALFSAWWLKCHRFGPLEWLWRTLMYGVRQPMHVSSAPT